MRSLGLWRIWTHLGWRDVRVRYALTALGPAWTTINILITSVFLGVVYSAVFSVDLREYLPYVAAGIMIWTLVSVTLTEASNHFSFYRTLLLNTSRPLPVFTISLMWRNAAVFLMSAPVVMVIVAGARGALPVTWLWIPIAALAVVASLLPLSYLFGILGLRYPDLVVLLPSLLFLVFLTTPILWSPDAVGERSWIYQYNPIYWLIELLRRPLLGQATPGTAWLVCGIFALSSWILTVLVGRKFTPNVRLWL